MERYMWEAKTMACTQSTLRVQAINAIAPGPVFILTMAKASFRLKMPLLPACLLWVFIIFWAPFVSAAQYPPKPKNTPPILDVTGLLLNGPVRMAVETAWLNLYSVHKRVVYLALTTDAGVYGVTGDRFDGFAADLFRKWQIEENGALIAVDRHYRTGMVVLGSAWPGSAYRQKEKIVSDLMLPALAEDQLPESVLLGIQGLNAVAGGEPLPVRSMWWQNPKVAGWGICVVLTGLGLNLVFRYRQHRFWVLVPYLGTFLHVVEKHIYRPRVSVPRKGGGGPCDTGGIYPVDLGGFDGGDGGGE